MNLLCQIYSDTSEVARLVNTLIAAIIAVLVVYLTHVFSSRRLKNELKLKKYEETYEALTKYKSAGWALMHSCASIDGDKYSDEYGESHNKVEMLAELYVQSIKSYVAEMNQICLTAKSIEEQGVESFQQTLKRFISLAVDAEREIIKLVEKNV